MHELSVMTQIVETLKKELAQKEIIRVKSVRLEIGELMMLGKEQLLFAWGILIEDSILKGGKLVIVRKSARVECLGCGFRGRAVHPSRLASHFGVPLIACPKCNGQIRITSGKECIIRSISAVVPDSNDAAQTKKRGKRKTGKKGKLTATARYASRRK